MLCGLSRFNRLINCGFDFGVVLVMLVKCVFWLRVFWFCRVSGLVSVDSDNCIGVLFMLLNDIIVW